MQALEIVKTSTPDEVLAGGTVEYTVTVTNTGGVDYVAPDLASFTDDLSEVLDDAVYDGDAAADVGSVTVSGDLLAWAGPLPVDGVATITYSVTVNNPLTGDGLLTNAVTGPPESGCVDGTEEGCTTTTPVQALDIVKSKVSPDTVEVLPGEEVTYQVEITNSGQVDYPDVDGERASFEDDLSEVLDDATLDETSIVVDPDVGTPDFTDPTLSWTGPLAVGETVTVTYTVTVNAPLSGDGILANVVTGPPESSCVDPTAPGCFVVLPERALDIEKTASEEAVAPGDTVTYTVTATNLSEVPYTEAFPALVVDDLTGVLDDATLDEGSITVDPESGELDYTEPQITWTGPIPGGESVEISYTVTVDDPITGDGVLANVAFQQPVPPECPDGEICPPPPPPPPPTCPPDGIDPDTGLPCAGTTTPVKGLDIVKSSDADPDGTEVAEGDVVEYSVEVTNTGTYAYTDADPAVITDDLSDVLDDASYNDDATVTPDQGAVSVDGSTLTWSGPLDPGDTVTITYSVTIGEAGSGDGTVRNVVTGPPESTCVPDSADETEGCTTTAVVPPPAPAPPTTAPTPPPTTPPAPPGPGGPAGPPGPSGPGSLPMTGAELASLGGLALLLLLGGAAVTLGAGRVRRLTRA
ncbi:hypothetical protein GCM10025865_14430 [Paraoerskovia sediminicola]|uniref:DUF7927 domain-containing protein n=1 Tax=Paraoerskovia sediminicola TaxID=1138587 RepID=A0ABM8G227_9CELL|nr:hypothetical protein [Paraoerskovia sediminicola]BDZ42144.1 hypothetical protein GCM10025865_14430 [Paraoerskovia sediminicola]